jgi:hypothetical protein
MNCSNMKRTNDSPPPANPDIKRELKKYLLALPARSFEFFADDFLVYIGLEAVSVTRYIGDGGIDAQGDLLAGMFRILTRSKVASSLVCHQAGPSPGKDKYKGTQ